MRKAIGFVHLGLLLAVGPGLAQQGFCIGTNCGLDLGFHCHSVDQNGDQCWDAVFFDSQNSFETAAPVESNLCEREPGFSLANDGAISCLEAVRLSGASGGVSSQLPTLIGGYNLFRSRIRARAVSRVQWERMEAMAAQDAADDAESTDGVVVFSEITTSIESDRWTYRDVDGDTNGVRFEWGRQGVKGGLWGASGSYQDASPDFGESSRLLNANVSFGHTLGSVWSWSVSGTASDLSGFLDDTLYGAAGELSFSKYFDGGSVLSGGALYQYQSSDLFGDDFETAGYGLAFGFPLGRRFALNLEGYGATVVSPDVQDDAFYTLGGSFSAYFTPRFALTLGYRRLEGIDELDSGTYTLGSSSRW